MNQTQELIIIGGGPIGLACGIAAAKAGLKYLILEKGALVNSIMNYPLNMTFFSTSVKLEIGAVPFVSHHTKPNRTEALEYYRRVADSHNLQLLLYTSVTDIKEENGEYILETSRGLMRTRSVIIATGFYDIPQKLNIPGEELPKVLHYYKEPHPFTRQKVAVAGAANSAVDAALETYRKGAEVTMIIRENKISDRVKYWVKPDIENRIASGEIKAYFNSSIKEIAPDSIEISTPEGELKLENDFVLAMTGYTPDFTLMEKAGIMLENNQTRKPVYNPDTMETNKRNIYLAGVICGGLETHKWFIENSRIHAEMILRDLAPRLKG